MSERTSVNPNASEDMDIVDSPRERLDLEYGLLSCGGRETRHCGELRDSEPWEPVELW